MLATLFLRLLEREVLESRLSSCFSSSSVTAAGVAGVADSDSTGLLSSTEVMGDVASLVVAAESKAVVVVDVSACTL